MRRGVGTGYDDAELPFTDSIIKLNLLSGLIGWSNKNTWATEISLVT